MGSSVRLVPASDTSSCTIASGTSRRWVTRWMYSLQCSGGSAPTMRATSRHSQIRAAASERPSRRSLMTRSMSAVATMKPTRPRPGDPENSVSEAVDQAPSFGLAGESSADEFLGGGALAGVVLDQAGWAGRGVPHPESLVVCQRRAQSLAEIVRRPRADEHRGVCGRGAHRFRPQDRSASVLGSSVSGTRSTAGGSTEARSGSNGCGSLNGASVMVAMRYTSAEHRSSARTSGPRPDVAASMSRSGSTRAAGRGWPRQAPATSRPPSRARPRPRRAAR